MADYVTLTEVLDEIPKITISANTKPNIDDAERMIEGVEGQINSVLAGLGYVTPVTGPESVLILKDIAIQGSIAKILRAMFIGVKDLTQVGATDAQREFLAKLKSLARPDDPLSLPDADMTSVAEKVTAELSSNFITDPEEMEVDRPTRDQVF